MPPKLFVYSMIPKAVLVASLSLFLCSFPIFRPWQYFTDPFYDYDLSTPSSYIPERGLQSFYNLSEERINPDPDPGPDPESGSKEECVCNHPDIKVFNLGLMKAGSTSIHSVMKKFGCRSLHHGLHLEKGQDTYINVTKWNLLPLETRQWASSPHVNHLIARVMFLAEKYGHPLLYYFENDVSVYSQLEDSSMENALFPQMTQFKVLHEQYPNSKFILIKRNITAHIESMGKWGNLQKRLTNYNVPYLPPGKGGTKSELKEWIKRHYKRVHNYFMRKAPDQYLEIQLEDGGGYNMARIKAFTHCTGNFSMMHKNKNNATGKSRRKDRTIESALSLEEQAEKYSDFWEEMNTE